MLSRGSDCGDVWVNKYGCKAPSMNNHQLFERCRAVEMVLKNGLFNSSLIKEGKRESLLTYDRIRIQDA